MNNLVSEKLTGDINCKKNMLNFLIFLVTVVISFYLSKINFTLFHTIIEIICAFVGFMIFMIAMNTIKVSGRSLYINFLGISYGFIAVFDLMNGLTVPKLGLFPTETLDMSIRMAIIARYMESFAIILSLLLIKRDKNEQINLFKIKNLNRVALVYLFISSIFIIDIFTWNIFPKTFIQGIGITQSKIINEYIVSIIFFISLIILYKKKNYFSKKILVYFSLSIVTTILGELSMTIYNESDLFSIAVGHVFRLISFIFIYRVLIEENVMEPYRLLNSEIIERKKAQLDLSKKTNILNSILESTNDGIIVLNRKKEIIHFNKKFINLFDIDWELRKVTDDKRTVEFINEKFLEPSHVIDKMKNIYDYENGIPDIIKLKNGKILEASLSSFVMNGEKDGYIFSFKDVTQKKIIEKELDKNNELYKKLLELLPDAVYVEKDENIIIANKKGIELSKFETMSELNRTHPNKAFKVPHEDEELAKKTRDKLSREETFIGFGEQKIILRDGTTRDVEIGASSFNYEDDHYILTIMRDISERKKAQELEVQIEIKERLLSEIQEYDNLKTQFFTTISHELKTPLNVILGTVQLLESTKENIIFSNNIKVMNKYLKMMRQNCYRLLRLIGNLIDITKVDAGFLTMNIKNYNIVSVIEETTLSVADFIKSKGIRLVFDTEIEEKIIACDAEKFERVLLNLLSNAIKFTGENGEISVNVYNKKDSIVISVKDTGIGIPDDMKDKIFERFRQVDTSLRRKAEGSGIGLSIVKSIIELHGGSIKVKSELEKGSEFIIELPTNTVYNDVQYEVNDTSDTNVEMIKIEFSDIYL
ncbi:sensor histidine kinase TodS [Gottschalkia purinilytica]|uniref:histidine kinase n=1 Tax=Gottschalkia purinilytica TaxID=1503 RepID=A0A0L0WDS9_GOTPU|nr:MASE3 domain-containing protein [Gottschalkia purinilytica]KNF09570.1 sensor histidine kinase TodS [Gottschalkia purinilytica]